MVVAVSYGETARTIWPPTPSELTHGHGQRRKVISCYTEMESADLLLKHYLAKVERDMGTSETTNSQLDEYLSRELGLTRLPPLSTSEDRSHGYVRSAQRYASIPPVSTQFRSSLTPSIRRFPDCAESSGGTMRCAYSRDICAP